MLAGIHHALRKAAIAETTLAEQIAAVRCFSRFYTREMGILHEGLLQSP